MNQDKSHANGATEGRFLARQLGPWLIALLVFVMCLLLYTRHNTFAFYYHTDEPGKVRQLITGERNFHHPLLLLTASDVAMRMFDIPRAEQNAVVCGRWVSAVFASIAVVALAMLAYHYRGAFAAVSVGLLVGFHSRIFEFAHYLKEDPALLTGIALTLLAMAVFWSRPTLPRAAALGAACALAISAKYVGVIVLAAAVPVVLAAPSAEMWRRRSLHLLFFVGAMIALVLVINSEMITQWPTFTRSLGREVNYLQGGPAGATRDIPHSAYLRSFIRNIGPVTGVLILIYLVNFAKRRRTLPEWIVTLSPYLYIGIMSFVARTADRYILPAYALACYQAGMGIDCVAAWPKSRRLPYLSSAIAPVVLLSALAWQGYRVRKVDNAFATDTRSELSRWVRENLPNDAVIAQGRSVHLSERDLPQRLITVKAIHRLGDIDSLQRQGITHAVLSKGEYKNYIDPGRRAQAGREEEFARLREFYRRLRSDGVLLWKSRGRETSLHPSLELYRLPETAEDVAVTGDGD